MTRDDGVPVNTGDLDDRIRAAVEHAIRAAGGQVGAIFLADAAGGLSFRLSLDRHGRVEPPPRVSRAVVHAVWSSGTARVLSDSGPTPACGCPSPLQWHLAVPIRTRDRLLGVLIVSGPERGIHGSVPGGAGPSEESLPALEAIARDLAEAIERATRSAPTAAPRTPTP